MYLLPKFFSEMCMLVHAWAFGDIITLNKDIITKLKFDYLKNEKKFFSETIFPCFISALSFKLIKQTSKKSS